MKRFTRLMSRLIHAGFIVVAGLIGLVGLGCSSTSRTANDAVDSKLPSKSFVLKTSGRRLTYVYRVPGNTDNTNKVCTIWEKRVGKQWILSSRDYYVAGQIVLIEEDIDRNGVAQRVLIHDGEDLVGVLRKGKEITGVVPQAEIDEIIKAEKSGAAAGEAIGSIIGTGTNGQPKTIEEIMEQALDKYEELRKKPVQDPK